jgi:hypothetical protein
MAFNQLHPHTVTAGAGRGLQAEPQAISHTPDGSKPTHILHASDDDERYYVADRGRARPVYEEDVTPFKEPPLWQRVLKKLVGRGNDRSI